jgi:3-oxoacyl-[acyl-carrier-protein] synthase-1
MNGATAARARPARIEPVAVRAFGSVSAAGCGQTELLAALQRGGSALRPNAFDDWPLPTWIGAVPAIDGVRLPAALAGWDCRAARLAWLGLEADGFAQAARAARARHGAARIGLALGTSASTIGVTEAAYRCTDAAAAFSGARADPRLNTPHALALFVREALGIEGPAVTVSTACSSSAKVFALAERWLRLGLVDAAVVGGVDAMCASVLYGFHALGLVSSEPCRPFDVARRGISVGEAAGFALLERGAGALMLIGHGEAGDAHHMSSPHPEGLGAEQALDDALARAGLDAAAIDHVNLHGTGTPKNDEVEAALVARRYAPRAALSATKGLTGHTMGAAGMLEAALTLLALAHQWLPGSAPTTQPEPALAGRLRLAPAPARLDVAASHSFGFGGSNCVLLFARGAAT